VALFLIETAKSELQESGLSQAETVSKASDILTETTEKIPNVLSMRTDIHHKAETRWWTRTVKGSGRQYCALWASLSA
jgi:hypothetical protein